VAVKTWEVVIWLPDTRLKLFIEEGGKRGCSKYQWEIWGTKKSLYSGRELNE
jgi:hypothetical protein